MCPETVFQKVNVGCELEGDAEHCVLMGKVLSAACRPAPQLSNDQSECRDSMKLSGLPLRHQLPLLTFDFAPVAYYPTPFASPDPSCFPPLSFTCVSCLEEPLKQPSWGSIGTSALQHNGNAA